MLEDDGRGVDGVILVPWANGQSLILDATGPDTLAPSYILVLPLVTKKSGKISYYLFSR